MKIWPCPHGTKMPDPGDLGTIDLDCPWTLYHNAPLHTSPANCSDSLCNIFSERGCHMIKLHLVLRAAPSVS